MAFADTTRSGHTRCITADKVQGTTVYNTAGEKLGSVDNVVIDKVSGKVAYAEMAFGGFLGMGNKHHPLPWSVLRYDEGKGGYVVNLDKDRLRDAPTYEERSSVDWSDQKWGKKVHDYYNVPPYWI